MTRSRSRSRTRQPSSYQRSRSRSPGYDRDRPNQFEQHRNFRGNSFQHGRGRQSFRRGRDDYRHSRRSPVRSPGHYKNRSMSPLSHSQHHQAFQGTRKDFSNDHHMHTRSPSRFERRSRSPSPKRLKTNSVPKEDMIFRGPEGTVIDLRELKKITVDIRRNIPRGSNQGSSQGPLRYSFDPADFVIIRRPGEGSRPIFDREELKPKPSEERVIKLAEDVQERMEPQQPSQSRDPFSVQQNFQGTPDSRSADAEGEGDLRYRLMEKKSNDENRDRINADPNFVPQGRSYYEHDNRERFNNRGRGLSYRGNNRGNYHNGGNYRGNYRGGGVGHFREPFRGSGQYRGKLRSPDWQHDLYDQVAVDGGKPNSTTQT